jgi:hypothetical protein
MGRSPRVLAGRLDPAEFHRRRLVPASGIDHAPFITEGRGYASDVTHASSRIEVIDMPWWEAVLFLIAAGVAIWGFISMVGVNKRWLTRGSGRRAQDLYGDYADSPKKQRRYAREHGGTWSDHG